jgi:hypothetical protein
MALSDWDDMAEDTNFCLMVMDILACYTQGDARATEKKILYLSESGDHSMGDISNAFEYFESVANDTEESDPYFLSFKERVSALLDLFRP